MVIALQPHEKVHLEEAGTELREFPLDDRVERRYVKGAIKEVAKQAPPDAEFAVYTMIGSCGLLEAASCTAYESRPLACQMLQSGAEQCLRIRQTQPLGPVQLSMPTVRPQFG